MTYKSKSNQRRRWGHRQHYATLEITAITAQVAEEFEMSKTKGGGSTRNGRDSNAQRLGVKEFDGTDGHGGRHHRAPARDQDLSRRQRRLGGDDTLFATADGVVKFGQRRGRRHVSVVAG